MTGVGQRSRHSMEWGCMGFASEVIRGEENTKKNSSPPGREWVTCDDVDDGHICPAIGSTG